MKSSRLLFTPEELERARRYHRSLALTARSLRIPPQCRDDRLDL